MKNINFNKVLFWTIAVGFQLFLLKTYLVVDGEVTSVTGHQVAYWAHILFQGYLLLSYALLIWGDKLLVRLAKARAR